MECRNTNQASRLSSTETVFQSGLIPGRSNLLVGFGLADLATANGLGRAVASDNRLGRVLVSGGTLAVFNRRRLRVSFIQSDFQAEGIIARPSVELFSRGGHRIITKIKCRDFPS
jgi:hypothetical protein